MVDHEDFDPSIALPPGLEIGQIRRAVEYVEREASGLADICYEQKNVFSAIVSILGTRALDSFSSYERHKNVHTAQQQFPDLVDPTESIEPGVPLVTWRVDVAFLTQEDWKYEGSTAGTGGGGRTHTFGVKNPATRFRDCFVHRRHGIRIRAGKPVPENGG